MLCFLSITDLFVQATDKLHLFFFLLSASQIGVICHCRPALNTGDKAVSSLRPMHEGPLHFLTGCAPPDSTLFFHCLNIFRGVPPNNPENQLIILTQLLSRLVDSTTSGPDNC